jgi:hypothetical protein
MLTSPVKRVVITYLDDTTLGNRFKSIVAEIEQEVTQFVRALRAHRTPVSWSVRARLITEDLVRLPHLGAILLNRHWPRYQPSSLVAPRR